MDKQYFVFSDDGNEQFDTLDGAVANVEALITNGQTQNRIKVIHGQELVVRVTPVKVDLMEPDGMPF